MAFDVAGILGTVSIANATYHPMSARGDGNCLFHAAGYLLERGAGPLAGQNRDHAWLRAEMVAWVRTQVTSHALTEPGATIAVHINNLGTDLGGWCGAMATDRTWGDELCVLALEHRFNVRIEVYQLDRDAAIRPANFPAVVSATTLRLLQPPTSQRGVFNHFDPLIDQPTQEERAARRYEAPRAPRMAWACADRTVVRQPWAPAILHAWYPRRWQERSGVSRFFASLTNTNTIDRNAPRVLSIILSTGVDGAIRTPAFTAESARDAPPDRAFRAPWQAPLVRKEDAEAKETWEKLHGKSEAGSFLVALDRVDWAAVSVAIRVRAVTAQTLIHFELRGKTGPAYAWSRRWSALNQFASATFASNGEELVSVPANHVVDLLALAGLSWPDSPYQLCAAPRAAHDQDDGAWTYLHVPSEWDVNTLETVGHERVAPLGDRMDHLAAAGATLTPRKDHGDEHRGFTPDQQATTKKVIRCLGEAKSAYDTNIHSVLLKRDNGRYQAVTSWATAVVAVLDVKLGRYVVHSVLYQSAERRLYRIDPAVDGPTADLGATELKEIESIIAALTMYRRTIDDVLTAYDRLAKHQDEEYQRGVIATGPAKTTPKWLAIQSLDAARDCIATEASNRIFERHGVVERRYVDEQTTPGKPICDALEEIISKLQKRQQEVGAALRHVRVTPQLRIEGVGDFDALNPGFGWYQWTPPRDEVIALDRVVTAGPLPDRDSRPLRHGVHAARRPPLPEGGGDLRGLRPLRPRPERRRGAQADLQPRHDRAPLLTPERDARRRRAVGAPRRARRRVGRVSPEGPRRAHGQAGRGLHAHADAPRGHQARDGRRGAHLLAPHRGRLRQAQPTRDGAALFGLLRR